MQLREELTRTCQESGKPGPSQPSVSTCEPSKDGQKVRFHLKKDAGKNLGHFLGKVPKNVPKDLESSPVKALRVTTETERDLMKSSLKSDSRNDLSRSIHKNPPENTLKAHVGIQSEEINKGLVPLSVRESWLFVGDDFSMSETHIESRDLASSKSWENCVRTTQSLSFLDPDTQQTLETHVSRLWVKHKWGLPLKALKPVNLFKLKTPQPMSLPQYGCTSSATYVPGASSKVEVAKFLGKPPQTCSREKVMINESVPPMEKPYLVFSPSYKEIKRSLTQTPSWEDYRFSEAPPTRLVSSQSSQTSMYGHVGRTCQSRTVLGTWKGSLDVSSLPTASVAQDLAEPYLQAQDANEFQHRVEMKPVNYFDVCTTEMFLPASSTDSLASQVWGDLGQQKHTWNTWRSQSKMFAPTYNGEDARRRSPRSHREMCEELRTSKLTQGRETEDTFEGGPQPLPKNKQFCLERSFQRAMKCVLHRIFSKKALKEQEEHPETYKPTSTTAQSQRKVKTSPHVDSNVTEAQKLMTTVGQMLERKMVLQHKLCGSKANQHKEHPHDSQMSPCHRPPFYPEQRRMSSYIPTPKYRRSPNQETNASDPQSLKNVQFSNEHQGPQHTLHLMSHNKSVSPRCPSHQGPTVSGASSHYHHCPRHCLLRRDVLPD
jgi:hypothetical protein